MLKRKKITICVLAMMTILIVFSAVALAHTTSYNVSFYGSSYIQYTNTIYGDSSDTYYADRNDYATGNYSGSRAYCISCGEPASAIASPDKTSVLYSAHRHSSHEMRYQAFSSGVYLCSAEGRYGVD